MKKLILYFSLIWPFLWDNATQAYQNAQIIEISKSYLRGIEVVALVSFIGYVLVRKGFERIVFKLAWFIPLLFIIGLISGLLNHMTLLPIFQVTYLLARPFIIFFILINLNFTKDELIISLKFYFIVALINVSVNIIQFIFSGVFADQAAGLMYHSHILANFVALTIFYIISYAVVEKRYLSLLLIVLFFPSLIITAHEKTLVLIFPALLILLLLAGWQNIKNFVVLFLFLIIFSVGAFSTTITFSPKTVELLSMVAKNVNEFGPIKAYKNLFDVFAKKPLSFPIGLGPGSYGSVYNTYGAHADELNRKFSYSEDIYYATVHEEVPGRRRSLWAARTNLYLAVLSEYGVVGFFLFLLAIFKLILIPLRIFNSDIDNQLKWVSLGTLLGLVYTFLLGTIYLLTGYNSQSNIFPLMNIAALVYTVSRQKIFLCQT